ncbi:hypothetical protein IQ07DRAFT_595181 [Pyrenochaeta sp. DS3sAY3a]|nr:hypothetical protein IQ07DRAFT_595181 [Pyrenochaeta sp. DS3sAY3a]
MADLTGAKWVRRNELESPASSARSSPDPDIEELLRSRLSQQYTFTATAHDSVGENGAKSDEDEIELRLFATTSNTAPQANKIRLSSPGVQAGEGGFRVKKPRSYYFADKPSQAAQADLLAAAIEGKTIIELSQQPWPGCALPWKVQKISPTGMSKQILVGHPPTLTTLEEPSRKRTRKNKKTRIAIRKKHEAIKSRQEEKAKLALERDEAEREKRTRRNREKKVKRKAKEKAKKAVDGTAQDTAALSEAEQDDEED